MRTRRCVFAYYKMFTRMCITFTSACLCGTEVDIHDFICVLYGPEIDARMRCPAGRRSCRSKTAARVEVGRSCRSKAPSFLASEAEGGTCTHYDWCIEVLPQRQDLTRYKTGKTGLAGKTSVRQDLTCRSKSQTLQDRQDRPCRSKTGPAAARPVLPQQDRSCLSKTGLAAARHPASWHQTAPFRTFPTERPRGTQRRDAPQGRGQAAPPLPSPLVYRQEYSYYHWYISGSTILSVQAVGSKPGSSGPARAGVAQP